MTGLLHQGPSFGGRVKRNCWGLSVLLNHNGLPSKSVFAIVPRMPSSLILRPPALLSRDDCCCVDHCGLYYGPQACHHLEADSQKGSCTHCPEAVTQSVDQELLDSPKVKDIIRRVCLCQSQGYLTAPSTQRFRIIKSQLSHKILHPTTPKTD